MANTYQVKKRNDKTGVVELIKQSHNWDDINLEVNRLQKEHDEKYGTYDDTYYYLNKIKG